MRRRFTTVCLAAAAACVATAAPAAASVSQEAQFQDDSELVYRAPETVASRLDTLRGLGVDRIRVTVFWRLITREPTSENRPSFPNGGDVDPRGYPNANWRRYDDLVEMAQTRGISVNFNVSGPAPDWGTQPAPTIALRPVWFPNPGDFGAFVQAVGTRYSGSYVPPGASRALPRVSYWSLWNEPNQAGFLLPQHIGARETSPRVYRALVDSSYSALAASGHGGDTILIGETAPKGGTARLPTAGMTPLRFIRYLYCVDELLRPFVGVRARLNGCPDSNQRNRFPAEHASLFLSSGFAHHPYSLLTPPYIRSRIRDQIGMADLPTLTRTLDIIFSRYGQFRRRPPLYITEFGYQSRPPDPYGFSQGLAAAYINQSEFMQYLNPRIRSTHQFLLVDDGPLTHYPPNSPAYWSTFQTGLIGLDGRPKLLFGAYRMPLYVVSARRRFPGLFRIWGGVRHAPNGVPQTVQVQYRSTARGSRFRTVRRAFTRSFRNYVDVRVRLTRSGFVRLAWANPAGGVNYSRTAGIVISRR